MLPKRSFHSQRLQELYEREISRILYKLSKEKSLPLCSVTASELSGKGENLKIYLTFFNKEEKAILKEFNKTYITLIKNQLINSKLFPRLPRITFFFDQRLEEVANLEKIIQAIEKKN